MDYEQFLKQVAEDLADSTVITEQEMKRKDGSRTLELLATAGND